MNNKLTLGVIFGGVSSEHDISCISAKEIVSNLDYSKYNVVLIGITKEGRWFLYNDNIDLLPEDKWIYSKSLVPAFISPDTSVHGIITSKGEIIKLDVVFPVLHGKNGEDGTMQGLLELSGLAYVGCGHLSSAVTMDKAFTNLIADFHGVKQAKWLATDAFTYGKRKDAFLKEAEEKLGLPIFVKPARAGSSVGISKAKTAEELVSAIDKAFEVDSKIVLEETVIGHEVECAIIGNDEPIASVLGEIVPCAEFYDFDAKYVDDSELIIPARLDEARSDEVRALALAIYKMFDCRGISRVDFFVSDAGEIYFNEINTIPGFTSISMHAKLFGAYGIPYSELVDKILTYACEGRA